MSLVSTEWLEKNLNNVKIIDCSWHMPGINRNPYEEYLSKHIPGAIFFDLDKNSEQKTDLPHMLPTREKWEEILSTLGIWLKAKPNAEAACGLWPTSIITSGLHGIL